MNKDLQQATLDIQAVASGHYRGAPSWQKLRKWAREEGVEITRVSTHTPTPMITATLAGCGGVGNTEIEALYLLHHTWSTYALEAT